MSKFSGRRPRPAGPTLTSEVPDTVTFEGAPAFSRDAHSDLFLLGVTNLVSEDTFYEGADTRDARFRSLVHTLTKEDPAWVRDYAAWLRSEGFMRSAPLVIAAEYIAGGGPTARRLVDAVLQRPDEPGELLAYWHQRFGRNLPAALKRGIADACTRLYTERAALRYDGKNRGYRLGDVIRLVHPTPKAPWQSQLFDYLVGQTLSEDHHSYPELRLIPRARALQLLPEEARRDQLRRLPAETMEALGSWERLSAWLPGGMDAEAWEAAIPAMGYMALLRNLRNFDQAGISEPAVEHVFQRLGDPEAVARSRQFPYRFLSAYLATNSTRWADVLERALNMSCSNLPELPGTTYVLTDTSASMRFQVSNHSTVMHYQIAALFAAALARRASGNVNLVSFATTSTDLGWIGSDTSVLRTVERLHHHIGQDGHGTDLARAIREHVPSNADRLVVFSDMQTATQVPEQLPARAYVFNTGGYQSASLDLRTPRRLEIGGFSDAAFRVMAQVEALGHGSWPWVS